MITYPGALELLMYLICIPLQAGLRQKKNIKVCHRRVGGAEVYSHATPRCPIIRRLRLRACLYGHTISNHGVRHFGCATTSVEGGHFGLHILLLFPITTISGQFNDFT